MKNSGRHARHSTTDSRDAWTDRTSQRSCTAPKRSQNAISDDRSCFYCRFRLFGVSRPSTVKWTKVHRTRPKHRESRSKTLYLGKIYLRVDPYRTGPYAWVHGSGRFIHFTGRVGKKVHGTVLIRFTRRFWRYWNWDHSDDPASRYQNIKTTMTTKMSLSFNPQYLVSL